MNTDYKDITDFLTEEPVKVNGHAPEKSADLIVFIHLFSTCCPHVFLIFLHYVFHMVWIRFGFVVVLLFC